MKPSGFNQGLQTTFTLFLSKIGRLAAAIGLRWVIAAAVCLIIFALPSNSCACRVASPRKAIQAHTAYVYKALMAELAESNFTGTAATLALATLANKHCLSGMPIGSKFEYPNGNKMRQISINYGWNKAPDAAVSCSVKLNTKNPGDFEVKIKGNASVADYESINGNPDPKQPTLTDISRSNIGSASLIAIILYCIHYAIRSALINGLLGIFAGGAAQIATSLFLMLGFSCGRRVDLIPLAFVFIISIILAIVFSRSNSIFRRYFFIGFSISAFAFPALLAINNVFYF
jgi:hypothetical protein